MKYYTEIVPFELAKKLKEVNYPDYLTRNWYNEKGEIIDTLPMDDYPAPTYAEVFDWLIEKGLSVELSSHLVVWKSTLWSIQPCQELFRGEGSFQEAADTAIETSCALLTEG